MSRIITKRSPKVYLDNFVIYFEWEYLIVYRPSKIIATLRIAFLFIQIHRCGQRMVYPVSLPVLVGGVSNLTMTYSVFHLTSALRAVRGANLSVIFNANNFRLASYGCLNYLTAPELRLFQLSRAPALRFLIDNRVWPQ